MGHSTMRVLYYDNLITRISEFVTKTNELTVEITEKLIKTQVA